MTQQQAPYQTPSPTPHGIEALLPQFTGSEQLYHHAMSLYYTEGVKFLAENAKAYWLIDAILSWQISKSVRREEFQLWTLKVHLENKTADLYCEDGNGNRITSQHISHTDFPLPQIQLYLEIGSADGKNEAQILLLPSEN